MSTKPRKKAAPLRPSRDPQNIRHEDWYYEFPSHLLIVHQVYDKAGNYIQTDQFKLPWSMIEKSRKRRPLPRGGRR